MVAIVAVTTLAKLVMGAVRAGRAIVTGIAFAAVDLICVPEGVDAVVVRRGRFLEAGALAVPRAIFGAVDLSVTRRACEKRKALALAGRPIAGTTVRALGVLVPRLGQHVPE